MPIYEYRCQACGHELEKLQKISDQPLVDCPECGKPTLTKLISAAGFRLKGGGWYETDFKKDNKRNLAGDGKSDKKSDGGSESKADSKPAKSSDKSGSASSAPAGQVA
ncbi:FmdB family zinc ribbon protein [Wenzhouxiangella sediminis]|uniref:Zinc ribbon domain-containing protein n=1 Tax=Wenzhouxiangella sediminis TaxID=1792836 RepID=A0A3E1K4V7_9GAMM|nr:zinc ribbon domain-containing protein [Wenzhouxiangella sediminis]RFF29051.1 zinc ribbon domain-containing protein [Wenzhouxiangella sediminis]